MKTAVLPVFCLWFLSVSPAVSSAQDAQPYIISGTVTDASGNPIEGAIVEWARWWDRAGHRQTVTDTEGGYRLEVDKGGRDWLLFASAKGFAPAWKGNFLFQPRGEPTRQNSSLWPGHWLEGNVMNTRGEPIPGITVKVTWQGSWTNFPDRWSGLEYGGMDLPGEGREVVTDENGLFRFDSLPAREVRLWINDRTWEQHSENHAVDQALSIALDEWYADWDKVIRGRVVDDETGEPVPEFTVHVYGREKTFRNEEGRFTLPGLYGGRYPRVFVMADGNRCAVGRKIPAEPEGAAPEHEFRVKSQGLEGYVVDGTTGKRLDGVIVAHGFGDDRIGWGSEDEWDHNTGPLHGLRKVVTANDGRFRFCEAQDEKGILVIHHEPYERLCLSPEERVYDPESGLLRVELLPEASISGIYLREGRPMPGWDIDLAGSHTSCESVTSDEEGRFSFHCLGPGEYRLLVYMRIGNTGFPILKAKTEVGPGEHKEFNLTGPDGPITVTGRTLSGGKPVPWTSIFLTPQGDVFRSAYACSNGEGRFRIPGLSTGLYDGFVGLSVIQGGKKDFTIEITGDTEMDLPPAEE